MNSNHVPLNAYIFIGLASVVMAVVTLMDSNVADNKPDTSTNESSSVTDMLPSFSNPFSTPANEQPAQPVKDEGNMFSGMFNSDNNVAESPAAETPNDNGFNPFGVAANSDEGLAKEAPPIDNPFQAQPAQAQPAQAQPAQAQPALFGGSKYNKTNKHKSKHNKKTKNHRKK
jgi:hypothetical protein